MSTTSIQTNETSWHYVTALTPEQLAEHLPRLTGINEYDTNSSITFSNVSVSGFDLSYTADEFQQHLQVSGRLSAQGEKTLIVITPPNDTKFLIVMAILFILMMAGMLWAGWPVLAIAPLFWLVIPLIVVIILGGFTLFYLRRWRLHRSILQASLSRLFQADLTMG